MGNLRFDRFFKPILEALRETGGSGTVAEIIDRVIERMAIPESEQEATLKSGESVVRNQVRWARLYLVRAGYLGSSKRGIWSLTERGMNVEIESLDISKTVRQAQQSTLKDRRLKSKA
jgi:restriction system protein